MQQGTARKMGGIAMTRRSIAAVLASLLIALFATVQSAAASIVPSVDGSAFGYRFIEENTSTLPGASAASAQLIPDMDKVEQQRFIESNTTDLPDAVAPSVSATSATMGGWRFLEVNTTMLPQASSQAYGEDLTPLPGTPR
jgi:hypothetical protein